jgi:antitoxin (DNA-binding transcriptional repressor) of toxin-antitoxin stability system
MKVVGLQQANLEACVRQAQAERVVLTQNGKPIALVVGVAPIHPAGRPPTFRELYLCGTSTL